MAASLDLDHKELGWQRRDDWRSHPQLAHRLAVNRFVTDLVAATLDDPALGVLRWYGTREAAARLGERMRGAVRPDGELILLTPAGPVDLLVEWDRGTETLDRLEEKLHRYRMAEHKLQADDDEPRSILFVVPGRRRLNNLLELCADLDCDGSWPILATTAAELHGGGALAPTWQRLDANEPAQTLIELPVRRDLGDLDRELALGRRWRHDRQGFWERLSPLGRTPVRVAEADLRPSGAAGSMPDPEDDLDHREGSLWL